MRIVVVCNYYSPSMGYAENCLPPALARFGHDVTIITSTLQPYGLSPFYDETYAAFLGPPVVQPGSTTDHGTPVLRLPFITVRDRVGLKGLKAAIDSIRPDVVEVLDLASLTALQAARAKKRSSFALFTANHVLTSVFPPAQKPRLGPVARLKMKLFTWLPGRYVNRAVERCYAPTDDAADVAVRFFGVDEDKIRKLPLGVDTHVFRPLSVERDAQERARIRADFGVTEDELLCVYTGRFTPGKDPACLAVAIELLRKQGHPFRAAFIGRGEQEDVIESGEGCTVIPFMDYRALGAFYRASDIGVWPRQESTSMLDGAASGLPIVVSDRIQARHRIEGNGLTYREGDPEDLATTLLGLIDAARRRALGRTGAEKMARELSWDEIARARLEDYERALAVPR